MKSRGTSFRQRSTTCIFFILQLSSVFSRTPSVHSPRSQHGLCTTPPCVHSASELLDWKNTTADPCEDFYEFACGNYDSNGLMQSAYSFWNQFRFTQQHIDAATKELLSVPPSCDEPAAVIKAKSVYQACMDSATISEKGTLPLLSILDAYGGWPVLSRGFKGNGCCNGDFSWSEIARAASQLGVQMIFNVNVHSNFFNSSQLLIYIEHDSLPTPVPLVSPGLVEPSETWDYLSDKSSREISPQPTMKDNLYVQYLSRVVRAIWNSRPASELDDFTQLEDVDEQIRVELRKVTLFMQRLKGITKNIKGGAIEKRLLDLGLESVSGVMTIRALQEYTDNVFPQPRYKMDWLDFLQNAFTFANVVITPDDFIYVIDAEKLMKVLNLVEGTDERILENFIGSRIASYLAPETTDELWKTAKWFYQQLKYITEDYSRWMHCNHVVSEYPNIGLGMAVAYMYRETYFDEEKLQKAMEMITELRASFEELVKESDWMDEKTKSYALEKADAMILMLGFPDWLSDRNKLDAFYKNLAIDSMDHFGNVVRMKSFLYAEGLKALRKDRTRVEWTQSPLMVNAFYNTLNNRITFPVGIMNRPFFSGMDVEALDYGRIGSIVGHEITHGFDSQGRLFDKYGTFSNWWSKEVADRYIDKSQCFIDQYNNYTDPYTNAQVNGKLSLSENIADNGGLRESYRAYLRKLAKKSKEQQLSDVVPRYNGDCGGSDDAGTRLPGLQQYTNEQLFFLGFATTWCDIGRSAQAQATNDNHAPNRFRVIGSLSNMEEFAKAWSCPEGSPMNPKNKCVLW